jgi:diaminopimelate decarboxylase
MNKRSNSEHSKQESLRFLTPEQVRLAAKKFGTPVYIYNESWLERQAHSALAFPNAFGLTVRYSLKAGASGAIIKIFDRLGLHFDASSIWEAMRAIAVGVEPRKILLTAQEVPKNLAEFVDQGLQFTACSISQLTSYGQQFPGTEVSIRINPGEGTGFINRLTSGGPKSSFGIWYEELNKAKDLIKEFKLDLKRIHQHIGSGHDPAAWARISRQTLELSKQFGSAPIINLGGGYRVKSLSDDHEVDYTDIGDGLRRSFLEYSQATGCKPMLEIEPGTYLTANCGSLVTSVVDVVSTGKPGYDFIKIDAGLTEVIRPGFYGSLHPLVSVPAEGQLRQKVKDYLVCGHCCIAGDMLTVKIADPEQIRPQQLAETMIGDFLVVERAGGYCSSMNMKNFNSFPEAPEVLLRKDGSFSLIRKRQTLEQMTQNEIVPGDI